MIEALDLFAGPGGTDEGARSIGIDPLGIELDPDACATRAAAGLRTYQGDVAALDPRDFEDPHRFDLVIASPPCPTWSPAGKREGHEDIELVIQGARALSLGEGLPELPWRDDRSALILEPLRWALSFHEPPRWIMLEQVASVFGLWLHIATMLEEHGWRTWAGIVECERYGIPQTRERAILMADRECQPHPPRPTHQRYVPGEPARHDITLEGEVLPWISMAEALGWGMTDRPSITVPSVSEDGGPRPLDGGSGARLRIQTEREAGRWEARFGPREKATVRSLDEPAPTLTAGHDWSGRVIAEAPALKCRDWPEHRPATTVAGDPRIFQPGGHHANDGRQSNEEEDGRSQNAIRIGIAEAAILQGFPRDYPFQGSMTEQFRQCGNAVPPPLAAAILAALCHPSAA